MKSEALAPGDVIVVRLPHHVPPGTEQQGLRPAVVVGRPESPMRFPIVFVVPLTSTVGEWAQANPVLYPRLASGVAGITTDSIVLTDQLRALGHHRILRYIGTLDPNTLRPILATVRSFFHYDRD